MRRREIGPECLLYAAYNVLLATSFSSVLTANEQHLKFETDTDRYELTINDQRISMEDMRNIAWLSPYIPPDIRSPFFMVAAQHVAGTAVRWEKLIVALPLETCTPSYSECQNQSLNSAFFENAARNLKEARQQLQSLRSEKLPESLERVRAYLAESLKTTLDLQEARYAALKTGSIEPLRRVTCQYCRCGDSEEDLFRKVSALGGVKRKEFTFAEWYNHVFKCFRQHDQGYPLADWNKFIKDFGIREKHESYGPDE